MTVPVSDLQSVAPSAIIELYELQLNTLQHGTSTTYRFHAGANLNANGEVVWAGNTYLRFPVEITGFAYSGRGALPRPTMRIANLTGTITALLLTLPNGLEGAKVTRLRTLARYLDAVNFPSRRNLFTNTNLFAWTESATAPGAQVRYRQTASVLAPDGTYTAIKLSSSTDSDLQRIYTSASPSIGSTITYSFYAKAAEYTKVSIRASVDATVNAIFDLTSGLWVVNSNATSQSAQDAGNGWYRISITYTTTTSPVYLWIMLVNASNQTTFVGNGSSGVYLWGAQVEVSGAVSDYQQVGSVWSQNPLGTPDPTALFPSEIYYIDRKSTENRDVIEFELASAFDLANVRAPKRQCISNICQWKYKSAECGYGYRNPAAAAAAINVTTNEITLVAHGMVTGDLMRIATTPGNTPMTINGTLLAQDGITNLVASNLRYAIKTSNDSFILASTQARAFAGLSDDIQSAGTGTHTFQTGFYQRDDTQAPAPSDDVCGKQVSSCKFRFGASAELAFGSYPGIGTFFV